MTDNGQTKDTQAELIEAIRQQTKADIELAAELRLQAQRADAELRAAQHRRQIALDNNDMLTGLVPEVRKAFKDLASINVRLDESELRAEGTDDILLAILSQNLKQMEAARDDLTERMTEREKGRRKVKRQKERRLAKLREKAALQGIDAPPEVLTEIEDLEEELKGL